MQLILALALAVALAFGVASAQLSKVDGTAMSSGGTPTLGTCGVTPSVGAGSTDSWGAITVGTGVVTSCIVNFSKTLSATPVCITSDNSGTISVGVTAVSTTSFTAGFAASLGGGVLYYHCFGGS